MKICICGCEESRHDEEGGLCSECPCFKFRLASEHSAILHCDYAIETIPPINNFIN